MNAEKIAKAQEDYAKMKKRSEESEQMCLVERREKRQKDRVSNLLQYNHFMDIAAQKYYEENPPPYLEQIPYNGPLRDTYEKEGNTDYVDMIDKAREYEFKQRKDLWDHKMEKKMSEIRAELETRFSLTPEQEAEAERKDIELCNKLRRQGQMPTEPEPKTSRELFKQQLATQKEERMDAIGSNNMFNRLPARWTGLHDDFDEYDQECTGSSCSMSGGRIKSRKYKKSRKSRKSKKSRNSKKYRKSKKSTRKR